MWWIFQIIGALGITIALMFARWYGINYNGTLLPWSVKMLMETIVAYSFIRSYAIAPSFFQPWFLSSALITLFGFLGSLIFFGEAIGMVKMLGAALCLIGAALLIL